MWSSKSVRTNQLDAPCHPFSVIDVRCFFCVLWVWGLRSLVWSLQCGDYSSCVPGTDSDCQRHACVANSNAVMHHSCPLLILCYVLFKSFFIHAHINTHTMQIKFPGSHVGRIFVVQSAFNDAPEASEGAPLVLPNAFLTVPVFRHLGWSLCWSLG